MRISQRRSPGRNARHLRACPPQAVHRYTIKLRARSAWPVVSASTTSTVSTGQNPARQVVDDDSADYPAQFQSVRIARAPGQSSSFTRHLCNDHCARLPGPSISQRHEQWRSHGRRHYPAVTGCPVQPCRTHALARHTLARPGPSVRANRLGRVTQLGSSPASPIRRAATRPQQLDLPGRTRARFERQAVHPALVRCLFVGATESPSLTAPPPTASRLPSMWPLHLYWPEPAEPQFAPSPEPLEH